MTKSKGKMKKRTALLLTAIMILCSTACGNGSDGEKEIDITSGSPWIDSEIIGAITEESDHDLKDDYAAAVNKEWILNAKLYPGYTSESIFVDAQYNESQQIKELMTIENSGEDPDLATIQSFYGLYMDWDSRNAAGADPLIPSLEQLEAIDSLDELTAYFSATDEERFGCDEIPVSLGIGTDTTDSLHNIVYIGPSALLMEDASEYETETDYGELFRESRSKLIRKILIKAGYSREAADQKIENALAFEGMIADSMNSSDETLPAEYGQEANDHVTLAELEELQGNIPLVSYLMGQGLTESQLSRVLLTEPEWLDGFREIYTEENVTLIRDYMIVHYALDNAFCLDKDCYDWAWDAIKERSGISEARPTEEMAAQAVTEMLGWSAAKAYCHQFASEEDKERIEKLCREIIAEYKIMLQKEDFLSQETIRYACKKLDNMAVHCLYPDEEEWPDTGGISFAGKEEGGTYFEALKAIDRSNWSDLVATLDQENDRTQWDTSILPNTVNCFNDLTANSIYILAGFCQGELYNADMPTEQLYGILGCTIGHEISHAFDSSGARYDKDGNLANWWTQEDLQIFEEKNRKMIDYYNSISPWEGEYVHGEIVTGEAGADMAGMKVMLQMAESMDGFDYDRFFRAFDSYFTDIMTLETEQANLMDEHPLEYLRANVTLAQFDEFDETYGIKEGDNMYIAPEDRVIIW